MDLINHPPVLKSHFFNPKVFMSNSFLFLIMSHQSQNSSLLYLRFKLKYGLVLFSNSLFSNGFLMLYLSWNLMNTRTHHCWSLKIWKHNYSPKDRFLIKFFVQIISLDSSQRVPPMSPCLPLIIIRVCPLLINPHVPNVFFLWICPLYLHPM